ncbi:MAG: CAP domain-containing protein [Bacteroidota bacterium]
MKITVQLSLILLITIFSARAQGPGDIYEEMPNIGNCDEGILKDQVQLDAVEIINEIRALHGLAPVDFEPTGEEEAQQAALICAANGSISHFPPETWTCYTQIAADGAMKSNLFFSGSGSASYPGIINSFIAWMHDDNTPNVGHRRSIINPFLKKVAFGRVDGNPVSGPNQNFFFNVMTMNYQDYVSGSIDPSIEFVAHPHNNYPPKWVDKDWYLSFSVFYDHDSWFNNDNVDYTNAQITITDENENQLTISEIIYDTEGWGSVPNCLKFKVNGLQDDTKYTVNISNITVNGAAKEYEYWFNLTDQGTVPPPLPHSPDPSDGAEDIATDTGLSWQVDTPADSYHLMIATDQDFSSTFYENDQLSTNTASVSNLELNTVYYWKVRSKLDDSRSEWSDTWSFTTTAGLPETVAVLLPEDQSQDMPLKPQFSWEATDMADYYELQIDDNPEFVIHTIDIFEQELHSTTYTPSEDLKSLTTYYWRVRGVNDAGNGEWSEVRSFMTMDASSVADRIFLNNTEVKVSPNPVSDNTEISINMPDHGHISLKLYDLNGHLIKELYSNYAAGSLTMNENFSGLAQGTYLLRLGKGAEFKSVRLQISR